MNFRFGIAAWAVLSLGLGGCVSFATMGTARTLPEGHVQFLAAPSYETALVTGDDTRYSSYDEAPQLVLGANYGLTDRVELGVRAWLVGAQVGTKLALLRPDSDESGLNLSLAPSLSYAGIGDDTYKPFGILVRTDQFLSFQLPALVGIRWRRHELVLGARAAATGVFSKYTPAQRLIWSVGGSVGLAVRLHPRIRVVPEVAVLQPIGTDVVVSHWQRTYLHFGVAFLIGTADEPEVPAATH